MNIVPSFNFWLDQKPSRYFRSDSGCYKEGAGSCEIGRSGNQRNRTMMVVHLRVTGDRLSRDLKTGEGSAGTMKITTHKQHVERSWQGKDHLTREAWVNRGYSDSLAR